MPEIPEIETVRRHLEQHLLNKTIHGVEVFRDKTLNVPANDFVNTLTGQKVVAVRRRAKIIILSLSNNQSVLFHLMLEGYVRFVYPNEQAPERANVILLLETGERLAFCRMYLGYVHLAPTTALAAMPELEDIGPEPLAEEFTVEVFRELLESRKGSMIKPLLMEQSFIAGIGNVYSNEVLFCSRILPTRKVSTLSAEEAKRLYDCLRNLLAAAVQHGGVYEEKFASDDQLTGGYIPYLQVAYRTGEPCPQCGGSIVTAKVGGRNAFYCPVCQK